MEKQKEEELTFINRFKIVCEFFPAGDVIPPTARKDPPDFVMKSFEHKIRIEVTKIYKSPFMRWQEGERRSTVDRAEQIYKSNGYSPVRVDVICRDSSQLIMQVREILATDIAELVAKYLPSVNEFLDMDEDLSTALLFSESITDIRIARFAGVNQDSWGMAGMGWTQKDLIDELEGVIDKKSKKILKPKTICDEYWLLCVAENMGEASFLDPSEETATHQYHSNLQRIFFLSLGSDKWIELRSSSLSIFPNSK